MTLFIPQSGRGFISPDDGTVTLKRILIPIDHDPQPANGVKKGFAAGAGTWLYGGEISLGSRRQCGNNADN